MKAWLFAEGHAKQSSFPDLLDRHFRFKPRKNRKYMAQFNGPVAQIDFSDDDCLRPKTGYWDDREQRARSNTHGRA
jgi:hypothetical protein